MRETISAKFEVLDDRFRGVHGDRQLEMLHTGCRWTEGPAYFPAGRYLVFSDIPNDRVLRWDETTGTVGVFRQPSRFSNGHTVDRRGRLVSCEHGGRQVTRTEPDGSVTVLAGRYQGKLLNSPNDVVERADGSIWFTDPAYGIDSDYEGHQADSEIGACHVYRIDPASGALRIVAGDFNRPNGLAFTQDERRLYICDSEERHIRLFTVSDDGTGLTGGEVFARCEAGHLRRHPAGQRGPGLGGRGRRAALPRPGRHPARQAACAGDRGQPDLRRPAAQPDLHVRHKLGLLDPAHGPRGPLPGLRGAPGQSPPPRRARWGRDWAGGRGGT